MKRLLGVFLLAPALCVAVDRPLLLNPPTAVVNDMMAVTNQPTLTTLWDY